jgi:hypothetical protein
MMKSPWSIVAGGILACALVELAAGPADARTAAAPAATAPASPEPAPSPAVAPAAPTAPAASATSNEPHASLARTYGELDAATCLTLLDDRGVAYERLDRAYGINAPVRLDGPLHGVVFALAFAPEHTMRVRREVLDCRLALALDDLAEILAARGVSEVQHFGIYRADVAPPKRGPAMHHLAGLAIDVAALVKDDGERLEVRADWRRSAGESTCRDDVSRMRMSERSSELRSLLCGVVDAGIFHEVLTPNHDAHHRDHFHMEIMRHSEHFIVR